MKLAKDHIDIGIQTNRREEMLAFWGETIGLPYDELLKVGGGMHQHRHTLNGSIFKLNHLRTPLAENDRTEYVGLMIACDAASVPEVFTDPNGNRIDISQRASLTGALPDNSQAPGHREWQLNNQNCDKLAISASERRTHGHPGKNRSTRRI